ncbi:kinase-like protein [Punctularia strigosozonata HHB-11173 SS5]|uniref:kinase-like protein n=1 Tax=Punctularia strigosozonata (strain HHB-11173) TaxID=741275 RepID=UPI0004416BA7|nr:kinase-like protein [Punctularia strigosozonata HHB-11173 SS5]EIN13389.1 kinase-like protein [Punctularia strigosozonata HHB-11173 SS5]
MITTGRPLHNSWKSYVDSSPTSRYTPSPPRSMSPAVGGLRSNPSTDSLASSISVPVCRTGRPPLGAAFVGSGASKQNVVDIQASKRDCECLLTIISWSLESAGGICSVDHKSSLHSLLEAYLTQRANRVEQTWPHSQPDVSALLSLSRADACCLMDIIDEALKIEIGSPHRCMRLLRRLCSQSECLPSSHMLHGDLVKLGDGAVATGGSADVWLGRFGSQRVAMKVLRIHVDRVQKIASKFCEEASLWKRLSHRNILVYHGVAPPNLFPLCMVSEWHPFRNVLDYVCEHPEANRPGLIRDVANGLQYLHEKGIVHADLKSANVLVKADHHACLADFGLAAVTHDPTTSTSFATSISTYGTWRYMAPELLQASVKSTFKSDMYSFAMVILEIFSNSIPFPNMQDGPVVTEVSIRGNRPPRPTQATQLGLSDGVWLTMQRYWDADPAARPGVQEVVNVMKVDGSLHDCECPSCVEP